MDSELILIVDDEPQNLAAMRQVLAKEYRLVFALNGHEALEVAKKQKPGLILMDIDMPVMNGYQACQALSEHPDTEHIPVIFVTSLSQVGDEATGLNIGAVDYLTKPISPPIVKARVRIHLSLVRASQLKQSYQDAIYMLGTAGHYNDLDTGVHIWRMAAYARAIAIACGWDVNDARQLELAAPMHDTGKMGIPGSILRKPAKLNASEWAVMRTHTTMGYNILSKSRAPVFKLAAEVALRHHEKWDGSGYPDGLAGEDIPESARIVAIADVFDALTMKRPYKEAWSVEESVKTIQESAGSHFDPRLVSIFMQILPEIRAIKNSWDAHEDDEEMEINIHKNERF
ncbi:response regulator [Neptunicella marina]|uniref:Response regulator n=1 Tax=Neptunicella marina TaxID=2125989 RepID=A0A8J6ISB2_9ALTE|nr:HD domain-containing phosphohydrolase [Neptunicella marina]MBC3766555.1 response regulator [Neptunicella marina]